MRYVRVEDRIGKIFLDEGVHYCPEQLDMINSCKQADTIEELCDEFVMIGGKGSLSFRTGSYGLWGGKINTTTKELQSKGFVFYGAIWTDKGLIYVAKMNEKGELELL